MGSTNWSGQVDEEPTGDSYTSVSASWVVPTVIPQGTRDDDYSATWVGIGGAVENDGNVDPNLIQVGTEQDTIGDSTEYSAWWEVLPATQQPLSQSAYRVEPGDDITASISESSPGSGDWTITISDSSESPTWQFSEPYDGYTPAAQSAEAIEEAPTVGNQQSTLANFGSVTFSDWTYTGSAPSQESLTPAYMISDESGQVIAYPSTPSSGTFTVTYGTPPPQVTSVSPTSGSFEGGTVVTIEGSYISGATSVKFGSTAAGGVTTESNQDFVITVDATTPAESPGSVQVTLTTPGGSSTWSGMFTFTAPPSPSLSGISPSSGTVNGGTSVTVSGSNLSGGTVFVGGSAVGSSCSSSSCTFTTPAGPPGAVAVAVETSGGTSNTESYTYVSSGYDLVGADGGVFVFPPPGTNTGYYGSLPGLGISVDDIVGMVPTSNDQGYFLVGKDGGVFAFGNAPYLGSLPGLGVTPAQPITGIVPTSNDQGYFLVGKDGGVFAFGNAPYLGSLPGEGIHRTDIIGIAATPSGNGYWLVASDGTVYAFGAAQQLGSATGTSSPVSAIAGTPDGGGYWIVTQNGSVYPFGDASSFGSLPALGVTPALPVIGIVHTADDGGYWLIGADGGIFAFGDAPYVGSLPGLGIHVTDIVGAVPTQS